MKIRINLVPPYKKEEIKKAYQLRTVFRWESELLGVAVLFIAMLVSMSYVLKINLTAVSSAASMATRNNEQYKTIEKYDNEVKGMNEFIGNINKIQNSQLYWSKFLLKFNDKVPLGITINKILTNNYSISVLGTADTRDTLISFRENIKNDDCFTDINLPLADLVSRENVEFQMDFKIKKECLK
jgi:hypothetical protein